MNMKKSPLLPALVLLPILLLASCGSPPGVTKLDRPTTSGPLLSALFNPDKLTPETQAYLKERDLLGAYHKDPSATILSLRQGLTSGSSSQYRVAVIELCSDQGARLAKREPSQAVGYYLAAAELSFAGAGSSQTSEQSKELRAAYNHSSGQVASLLFDSGHAWGQTTSLEGPGKTYRLRSRTGGAELLDPGMFDELDLAEYLEIKGVELKRIRQEGMGSAMVGFRKGTPERRAKNPLLPAVGMSLPVNATLEFSQGGSNVEIAFHDLMLTTETRLGGKNQPLAADLTAPFGILLNNNMDHNVGWKGLLHPEEYIGKMGLFQLEPYRPDQIPVIFVHGLMSSPATWLAALNELRADPELRKRYQLFAFRYPTGFPIIYNVAALRQRIAEFQKQVDPGRRNPNMRNMVIIGHSMGGILSNAQIRSSGDTFTSLAFTRPIDEVQGLDAEQKAGLKELAIYKANPDITRAIFVASPHRGSDIARNPIGVLASKLIKAPMKLLTQNTVTNFEGMTPLGQKFIQDRPDSIQSLKPDNPGTDAILKQKIHRGVTMHSVIGRKKPSDPVKDSDDGVVPYWSAHLDTVASEKVVHATHTSINSNEEAIKEVGRILYLHAGLRYKR